MTSFSYILLLHPHEDSRRWIEELGSLLRLQSICSNIDEENEDHQEYNSSSKICCF